MSWTHFPIPMRNALYVEFYDVMLENRLSTEFRFSYRDNKGVTVFTNAFISINPSPSTHWSLLEREPINHERQERIDNNV